MKSIIRKFLSLSLAVVLASAPLTALASEALGDDLTAASTTVNERTTLNSGTFWSNTYSDLRQENYVVYSPNTRVTPVVTGGDYVTQLTTTSSAARALEAQGYRVVAGVNGDYYDTATGIPLGCVMTNGVLKSVSPGYYAVGFRADGSVVMGKPELSITAVSDRGASFSVSALDQVRQSGYGIYLYDSAFNARGTIGTSESGVDVVCSVLSGSLTIGGALTLMVEQVVDGGVDTAVAAGKYVLSANSASGTYAATLRALTAGERLTVSVSAASFDWNGVQNMVGALYQLVENGAVCAGLPTGAAPRTAVGLKRDGSLVLYTIDGRRSGYSIGASLAQVAERMIELGCVTALSLDGGGSTTMVATKPDSKSASVINRPSGSERAVTNHLFLVATSQPTGIPAHVYLAAESAYALPNAAVTLSATVLDSNYIPTNTVPTLSADRGSIANGVLTMPQSGSVTVRAYAGAAGATTTVTVVPSADSVALQQDGKTLTSLSLAVGESVTLSASAMYRHLSLPGDNTGFAWSVLGDVGTVTADGVFTAALRAGSGSLQVSLGSASVTLPVTVTTRPLRTLEGFESASFSAVTGANALLSRNTDMAYVHNGFASARLTYDPLSSDFASLSLHYAMPSGYDRLNVWVYGDGSGAELFALTDAGSASLGYLDFTGWRLLSASLGSVSALSGFALYPNGSGGSIYLDQLVLSYGSLADSAAPVISLAYDPLTNTVSGSVLDDVDGAAVPSLSVKFDGKPLSSYTFDSATGALRVTLPTADGAQHRLTVQAGDASGNLSRASVDTTATDLTPPFADLQDHWASAAVSYLSRNGITNGSGDGYYSPETNITRQEFAVLLSRYLGFSSGYSSVTLPFADNARIDAWALDGVKAMYALGVIKGSADGYGNLYCNPHSAVSRQEVVTMLGRLLEKGYATPTLTFTDSASIQDWSREYVSSLTAMGILSGMGDGRFCPDSSMTRAQIAAVLYKML